MAKNYPSTKEQKNLIKEQTRTRRDIQVPSILESSIRARTPQKREKLTLEYFAFTEEGFVPLMKEEVSGKKYHITFKNKKGKYVRTEIYNAKGRLEKVFLFERGEDGEGIESFYDARYTGKRVTHYPGKPAEEYEEYDAEGNSIDRARTQPE